MGGSLPLYSPIFNKYLGSTDHNQFRKVFLHVSDMYSIGVDLTPFIYCTILLPNQTRPNHDTPTIYLLAVSHNPQ